jgi:hypothetical protein
MVSTLLILVVVTTALSLVLSLLHSRHHGPLTLHDWEKKKRDIDVRVFRTLVDADEERYLAKSLSRGQFAAFQRRRTSLALEMLHLANENASMLMRLGSLATATRCSCRRGRPLPQRQRSSVKYTLQVLLVVEADLPRWSVFVLSVEARHQHLLILCYGFSSTS